MDLPRFFLASEQIQGDRVVIQDPDLHHLVRVLRLRVGDRFFGLDGVGGLLHVELDAIEKHQALGTVVRREAAVGELTIPVTLVQGLPKGDKFEWIVQKATELGASRIVPMLTERTIVKLGDRAEDKVRRWQAIAKEAAEQCERAKVPLLEPPVAFASWLRRPDSPTTLRLACLERAGTDAIAIALASLPGAAAIEVVVGPEGGFTPTEAEALIEHGARPVSLGKRILRTETASLAALAVVASHLEA